MKVRFQADADFSQIIVRAVGRREPAVDFKTAHQGYVACQMIKSWPWQQAPDASWSHMT
jgi:hypothetical protein